MPLPSHLQQAILSSSKPKDPPNESQGSDTLEYDTPTEERTIKKADFTAYASPYALIPRSTHSASTSSQQSIVPSITPLGMDTYSIITERERRLQARIRYRMDELERLPGNLANHTDAQPNPWSLQSSHPHHDNNNSSSKLRAVIELKSLRLLSKQRKVSLSRQSSTLSHITSSYSSGNRSFMQLIDVRHCPPPPIDLHTDE
jgi:ATP-dependent helicase STH1/SNF2